MEMAKVAWYALGGSGVVLACREFRGICIPNQVEVMWNLATGDFSYWRGGVTDIEYNVPALY
jgi:hypothetical protein